MLKILRKLGVYWTFLSMDNCLVKLSSLETILFFIKGLISSSGFVSSKFCKKYRLVVFSVVKSSFDLIEW